MQLLARIGSGIATAGKRFLFASLGAAVIAVLLLVLDVLFFREQPHRPGE